MENSVTVLGRESKALALRKVVIWFGVIGMLLCSIVGSGILSIQEGAHPPGTTQPVAASLHGINRIQQIRAGITDRFFRNRAQIRQRQRIVRRFRQKEIAQGGGSGVRELR